MKALTISGGTLVRIALVAGLVGLAVICGGMAAILAFAGYILFSLGMTKAALFAWAAACVPLVTVGVVGALIAPRIHRRSADTFTPTLTGYTGSKP